MNEHLPTWVINLETSVVRMEALRVKAAEAGLRLQHVSAFDGRRVEVRSMPDHDPEKCLKRMGRPLLGGEYGCYRSHLSAAAQVVASGEPFGLVLEDDAAFGPEFARTVCASVARLDDACPGWQVLHLSASKPPMHSPVGKLPGARVLAAAHHYPLNTTALVWSREGAQAFCAEATTIEIPVDEELRDRMTRSGRGYCVLPAPVSTTQAPSVISVSSDARKRQGRVRNYWVVTKRRYFGNKLIGLARKLAYRAGLGRR